VRWEAGALRAGEQRFALRAVGYSPAPLGARPADSAPSCAYARDLPLIAAMGATTVRTYRTLPAGDAAFESVLATTGLHWLAGFSLEPYYDASRSLSGRRDEILSDFKTYVSRFCGNPRVIAYVFGDEVLEDYGRKFAGPPEDFYPLVSAAAALLKELEPVNTPLLATGVRDPALAEDVAGVGLWLWSPGSADSLASGIGDLRRRSPRSAVIAEYSVDSFDPATGAENEAAQARSAADLAVQVEAAWFLAGGVYSVFSDDPSGAARPGIFRPYGSGVKGLDGLQPRAVFGALANLWGGRLPDDWQLEGAPSTGKVLNGAWDSEMISPGALFRLAGKNLAANESSSAGSADWPLHLGESCLCVGGKPAPLGSLAPEALTGQIPWELGPGQYQVILFRAGAATAAVEAEVRPYAPGVFNGGVARRETPCLVSVENGARPGENLTIYATGLGPDKAGTVLPEVFINGTAAEVLSSRLMTGFTGMHEVQLRVDLLTPVSESSALELRMEGASSNLYPLSVAGVGDNFKISLSFPSPVITLQAGGLAQTVLATVDGKNGYCGPVLFSVAEAPSGISMRAAAAFTGQAVALKIRASPTALPQSGSTMTVSGYAPGAAGGAADLKVTVLPSGGQIPIRVVSGGYTSGPMAQFAWNGLTLFSTTGGGPGRGINVLAVDPVTGVYRAVQNFDTWGDPTASARLVQYLSLLPNGTVVLLAVADDGTLLLTPEARIRIAKMFGSLCATTLAYQQSWAMIGRKGASAPMAEGASAALPVIFEPVLRFPMQ
jgi:uncharacterized protein (TIGR03437 family)